MKQTVNTYLSHLWELGQDHMDKLKEEDFISLASRTIKETATRHIPKFEDYDHTRDVMFMMTEWMETEDDYLGHQILTKMRDLIITAMTPLIQDRMEDYAEREAAALREAGKPGEHERLEGYAFDKQRI